MEEALISIIIPVYNVEEYLEECLGSVLEQTYRHFEVVLIEDGSTDKSREICERFCKADKRFKMFLGQHRGVAAARNKGLENALGQYIVFVDSDDKIEKDMLEYLYQGICNYHTQIAICGITIVEGKKHRNIVEESPQVLSSEEALMEICKDGKIKNYLWAQIYEKQLFDGISFPEGQIFEDIAVYYRLIEKIDTVVLLDQIKYYYIRRKGSLSFGKNKKANIQRCYAYRKRYEKLSGKHHNLQEDMQRLIFINYRKLCKEWGNDRKGFMLSEVQEEKKFFDTLRRELEHNTKLTAIEKKEIAVLEKYKGIVNLELWILEGIRVFQKVKKCLCREGYKE